MKPIYWYGIATLSINLVYLIGVGQGFLWLGIKEFTPSIVVAIATVAAFLMDHHITYLLRTRIKDITELL